MYNHMQRLGRPIRGTVVADISQSEIGRDALPITASGYKSMETGPVNSNDTQNRARVFRICCKYPAPCVPMVFWGIYERETGAESYRKTLLSLPHVGFVDWYKETGARIYDF